MRRRPLAEIEAEIRATRGRLAALLAQGDRHYGLRAGLDGLRRLAPKPDDRGLLRHLALPAALIAFVAGVIGAHRTGAPPEKPDQGDKV